MGNPSQRYRASPAIWDHSIICHQIQVTVLRGAEATGQLPAAGAEKCPFAMQLDLDLLSFVHLHNAN